MSEENPSREDDQQQDSYLSRLPAGVNLGFDVAAFPPSYSNSPAPFDPTSSSDPTTSSVFPTGAAFSQALSRSRRRPSGQYSPLSTPPRVTTPSNTRSFRSRNNSRQEQGLDWNDFRRTCFKVAAFDEMARDKDAPEEIPGSTPSERDKAFSKASSLYATWHTSWSKPPQLDRVTVSAVSSCMTEPTEEEFVFKWDEANRKADSAAELIAKLPPRFTTGPEGGFF